MPSLAELRARLPQIRELDDSDALTFIQRAYYPGRTVDELGAALGVEPPAPPVPRRNLGAVANDTVIEVANAAAGGLGAAADFVAPGNSLSRGINDFVKSGEASQSDAVKTEKQRFAQEVDQAEGVGGELGAVGGYVLRNPLIAAAQAAGSFVGPGMAIKGAQGLARAAGAGAQLIGRAGLAGGALAGAAMAGGDAAGQAYELAKKAGASEEDAIAAARQASVIPAAIGGAGGLVGAERVFAGAGGFAGGALARAAKTGLVEGAQEAVEEGATNYEGRRAAMPFDPSIDPMKGTAAAAGMGFALGGATGAAVGAMSPAAEVQKAQATQRLAQADNVADMISAANDLAAAPLDIVRPEPAVELDAFGDPVDTGEPAQSFDEGSAVLADPGANERRDALISTLQDRGNLEQIREKLGDEAVGTIAYYAQQANRTDIPPATAERMLELAEMIVSRALARPITGAPQAAQEPMQAIEARQQGLIGMEPGPARIEQDVSRTGTIRVDAAGNAAPETRADQINSNQAQQLEAEALAAAQGERDTLGQQARKASAVNADPNPRRPAPPVNMPERRRTDAVEMTPPDPVATYISDIRKTNTPAARAFIQDLNAGRITRQDIVRVMQTQAADPLASIQQGQAVDQVQQRIERAAAQAPAPAAGIEPARVYRSRSAAFVEARKTGGTVQPAAGGFIVSTGEANAQPDMAVPAGLPAGAGDARAPDAGGSRGDLGLEPDGNRGRVAGLAPAPVVGGRAADAAGFGDQRDQALRGADATAKAPKPTVSRSSGRKPVIDAERDTMLQALAKAGGLNRTEVAREFGLKPEELKATVRAGNLRAYPFRNTGLSVDRAIEALQQYGYFDGVADEDLRDTFEAAIFDEFGGNGRLTTRGQMRRADELGQAAADEYAAEISEEELAERDAIMAKAGLTDADMAGLDDDIPLDNLSGDKASLMRGLGYTEQEIQDELQSQAKAEAGRQSQASPVAREEPGAVQSPDGTRSQEARPGRDDAGLTLEAQTAEDLRKKAAGEQRAAAADAAEQKRLADKAKADAQRDVFTLTGSDSAADVAAAAGQGGLFDQQETRSDAGPSLIQDAGEKIGGARKDRWKDRGLNLNDLDAMSESEGAELATKANVWKPDYTAMAERSEPVTAAMVKAIYDQLAAKPKDNTPAGRRAYVEMMQAVRRVYSEASNPEEVKNGYVKLREAIGLNASDPQRKASARAMLFSVYKGRTDPFVMGYNELARAKKMVEDGFPGDVEPWKRRFTIREHRGTGITPRGVELGVEWSEKYGTPMTAEQIKAGYFAVLTKGDNIKTLAMLPTRAAAEAKAKELYERTKGKGSDKIEPDRPHLDNLTREGMAKAVDRNVTAEEMLRDFGFRGIEFGNWAAQDERQRIMNMAHDALSDLATILNLPRKALSLNGTIGMAFGARGTGRALAHYEPGKLVINMTKLRGAGSLAHEWAHSFDHYLGELDRADAYQTEARGASGWRSQRNYSGKPQQRMVMENGKWVNKQVLPMDNLRPELARAVDKVMQLLYEGRIDKPTMLDTLRKQLERTREYAAAETDPSTKAMYERGIKSQQANIDEVVSDPADQTYPRGKSNYSTEAQKLSGKALDGYWLRPTEMFARAFESYVFDRLGSMGAKSEYLVHGVEANRYAGENYKGNPYPVGGEREAINKAFDALTAELKTRETDKGTAIFSRTGEARTKRADEVSGRRSVGLPKVVADRLAAAYEAGGVQRVNVARNIDELPSDLRKKLSGYGDDVRGAYFPREDEIWVFSDKVNTPEELHFVVLHEAFHRGLGHIFGDNSKRLLRQMYATNKKLRDRADMVARELKIGKDEAIEEALADMAGEGQAQSLRGWAKLAAMIRNWLNKLTTRAGLSLQFTNARIESFVSAVARAGISTDPDTGSRADGFDPDGVRVFLDDDMAAASRGESPERNALNALAQNDELFALPKSEGKTVERITGDIDPSLTVDEESITQMDGSERSAERWIITMPNGATATIEQAGDQVWLNAARLESGGGGAKVYQIAATYAHNTGRIFIGDPAGLSDDALRRRSEQMLSSALKFGTTAHLAPHPRQMAGDPALGVPALEWVTGDDIGNIRRLVDVNLQALENAGYGDSVVSFDPGTGQFRDSGGEELSRAGLEAVASSGLGRTTLAGGRTLARGAILRALLREEGREGQGSRGRNGLLAGLAKLGSDASAAVGGVFYSRSASMRSQFDQQSIRNAVFDRLSSAGEKVSWWDKTIGTQYAKAMKHEEFKPVFEAVQGYIEDTSAFANEAADMAPSILPKLESLRDVFAAGKRGLSSDDAKALAAPIFEGTLNFGRQGGKLVDFDTLAAEAEAMTTEQKERRLLADRLVSESELKRWKATPLDIYNGAIRNRYEQEYLQPGVVFTRQELRDRFKLTEPQIEQYEEFRAAVNESLDQVVASDILRLLGDVPPDLKRKAMENRGELRGAVEQFLQSKADAEPDAEVRGQINATWNDVADKYAKVDRLKARGYAPLMRFGKFLVSVKGEGGEQEFFGLYETRAEANKMARELGADPEFAGRVKQGVISQESYKLFSGVPVDSLEMFADALGTEKSAVFQEWLRLTKNNRSALKRLIKRKGTAGFSDDVSRVLASFVTSNARMAAGALNMPQAKELSDGIASGDLKDEAIKLVEAVQNPTETAGALRGLMFVNFIGGSIASALVNTTQPLMMTLPYLSQFGGATKAAGRLLASARMAAGGTIADKEMAAALKRGEQEGIVSPQEIHHLTAEAMSTFSKHPVLKRLAFLWGAPFSLAEQFNRRITFLAAYQTAKAEGMRDPFEFAKQAITETQGLYNKGNAPNLTRNAIGATALTFKQYSIHYLEWLGRMWNAGEPGSRERAEGRKAVLLAMALLLAAGGTEGLPFAEDMNDLFDTFMQSAGFDTSAKGWKREFLANTLGLGDMTADVAQRGLSALPGIPLDVSIRMGMGNLIPGTGMLLKSNTDVSRDVLELAGPAGGLINQAKEAGRKALDGELGAATAAMLPVAMQNVGKAASMWMNGEARDTKGRRVMETDEVDALMKLLGFQPAEVARESATLSREQRRIQLARNVESQIADLWAQGVRERDPDMVAEARQQLREWNEVNPRSRIDINSTQIKSRVKAMQSDRADRFERTAPKQLRDSVAEALQ